MSSPPPASTPACQRCGAPLPVDLDGDAVTCPACGSTTAVAAVVSEEARRYHAQVAMAHEAERRGRTEVEVTDASTRAAPQAVTWVLGFAVVAAAWFLLFLTGLAAHLGAWCALAALVATGLVMDRLVVALVQAVTVPPVAVAIRSEGARCQRCGGEVAFAEGESVTRCPFCAASDLVPGAVKVNATARARACADEAGARAAGARERYGVVERRAIARSVWAVVVAMLGVAAAGAVFLVPSDLRGPDLAPGWVGLGLAFVLILPLVVRILQRRRR